MMTTIRKLKVEVISATNLMPIDGHGTSSPYVVVDFHGQRKRTISIIKSLNPTWNETLEFNVLDDYRLYGDRLDVVVYHDLKIGSTTRNNFLGKVQVKSTDFVLSGEEAVLQYKLSKVHWYSWVKGQIGLKIYYADFQKTPPPLEESKPPSENMLVEEAPKPVNEGTKQIEETPKMIEEPVITCQPEIGVPHGKRTSHRTDTGCNFYGDPMERFNLIERSSFDLVDKMHYLFVKVVKARLPHEKGRPFIKISVSGFQVTSRPVRVTDCFEWDQAFAFARDAPDTLSDLQISLWASVLGPEAVVDKFLGGVCFDTSEILIRDPPDSQLAPLWYRLEGGGARGGDLMLATWLGTQADESFNEAWKTDTMHNAMSRSKIYLSPKMWYLRVTIIEAQDILSAGLAKELLVQVKCKLGFQVMKTKPWVTTRGSPTWNEDLMLVASEPFLSDSLVFYLECREQNGSVAIANARVSVTEIERRVDDRTVGSRWISFEDTVEDKRVYRGRVHMRVCFDGGYHVMEEAAHVCSDYRPTARQLWKPEIGTIELGIIGCRNLLPMKTINGKGSTDAYSVAKYGPKWVQTRTISDRLDPMWNEQFAWKVYDPCTVLTVGVFDNCHDPAHPDCRIGKVRLRISTLQMGGVYRNRYPLLLLSPSGMKKMGEIELAVRFLRSIPMLDILHMYSQPLLPLMHHVKPLGLGVQEILRSTAVKIVAAHLSRSEPPLRNEVVLYMLDANSHTFSMRKVRANWHRITNVVSGAADVVRWIDDTRAWKKPTATILIYALFVTLVWFPDIIVSTLAFYVFAIGAWNYRYRPREPTAEICPKISMAEAVDPDELDEEFDGMPCGKANEVAIARYDKLRVLGARVQTMLGDFAAQAERVQSLVMWRDPRSTGIFIGLCFTVALILYVVPSKMVAMASGFYYLRHPMFRDRRPSPVVNFFRRLPSLSDRVI